jgi:hypothetical protein
MNHSLYEIPSFLMNQEQKNRSVQQNVMNGAFPRANRVDGTNVDVDSRLRNGENTAAATVRESFFSSSTTEESVGDMKGAIGSTTRMDKRNLNQRTFKTAGYKSAGHTNNNYIDVESRIHIGLDTRSHGRACGNYADVHIDTFTPLVPCLRDEVQNVKHIVPEYWVRGGASTRVVVRNIDYLRMCGFKG